MRKLFVLGIFIFFSIQLFGDEYIRKNGSHLVVNELLPSIIGKTGNLELLAENIDYMEDLLIKENKGVYKQKLDIEITVYIKNSNLIFQIDIINSNIDNRLYHKGKESFFVSTDMPYKYFVGVNNWFYGSHKDSPYYKDINLLDPIFIFNYSNNNGEIQFQGTMQRSKYGVRMNIPVFFITCGPYELKDATSIVYGIDKIGPRYNPIDSTYSNAYFVAFFFSDYDKLMDIPVPAGLDTSFKEDLERIPELIENEEWDIFSKFVKKYSLRLDKYIDVMIKKRAPVSTFSSFSEDELRSIDFSKWIPELWLTDKTYIDFLYKTFDKTEVNVLVQTIIQDPDSLIMFLKNQKVSIKEVFDIIPETVVRECSLVYIQYVTADYDICELAPLFPKLESDRIKKILQNRHDNVSDFLSFYYLAFDTISIEKINSFIKKLELTEADVLTSKIYGIDQSIVERLTDNKYSRILQDLFDKGILKLVIKNSNDLSITTDFCVEGENLTNYMDCFVISDILTNPIFEVSYKLFSNELDIENICYPNTYIINNCCFSLQFDEGINYLDSKKKSGTLLFGELKNKKWVNKKINIVNNDNETLLFSAIRNNNSVFAQQLLKEGININIKNKEGKTALDIAREKDNKVVQKILEKKNH